MHESITRACSTRAAGAPITPRDLWPTRCPKCIALLPFLRRRRPPFATRHPDPIAAGGGCCTPQSAFEQRTRTPAVASRCKRSMPQRGEARRCSPGERRPRLGASFEGADVGGVNCVVAFHVVSAALSMPSIFSSTSRAGPATPSQGMTGQSAGPVVDARRPRAALVARCPRPSRPPTRPARGRSRPSTSTPGGRRRDEGTNGQSRRSRRLSDRHRSRSRRRTGRRSRWRRYRARLCTFMEALLHACFKRAIARPERSECAPTLVVWMLGQRSRPLPVGPRWWGDLFMSSLDFPRAQTGRPHLVQLELRNQDKSHTAPIQTQKLALVHDRKTVCRPTPSSSRLHYGPFTPYKKRGWG